LPLYQRRFPSNPEAVLDLKTMCQTEHNQRVCLLSEPPVLDRLVTEDFAFDFVDYDWAIREVWVAAGGYVME
jgi:hypothetical protein